MVREEVLLLFGDQTAETTPIIKELSRQSKHYLFLQTFFRKATDALHDELSGLQSAERNKYFPFGSILDLSESYSKAGILDTALSTVLLCVAQLACLIVYVLTHVPDSDTTNSSVPSSYLENRPQILADGVSRVTVLGLCTGLLPAAVLAWATSIGDVLEIVPEIVCISWRLGLEASHRSQQLEYSCESWATVINSVPNDELQAAIDDFHQTKASVWTLDYILSS